MDSSISLASHISRRVQHQLTSFARADVPSRSQPAEEQRPPSEPQESLPEITPAAAPERTPSSPSRPQEHTSLAGAKPAPTKTRTTRRHGNLTQSTTLESLDDDSMGPLGPLGIEPVADEPVAPAPPVKELASRTRQPASNRPDTAASGTSSGRGGEFGGDENISAFLYGGRQPPPVRPAQLDGRTRSNQPSVAIEQAAKPTFHITVGDPHTVSTLR